MSNKTVKPAPKPVMNTTEIRNHLTYMDAVIASVKNKKALKKRRASLVNTLNHYDNLVGKKVNLILNRGDIPAIAKTDILIEKAYTRLVDTFHTVKF